MRQDERKSLLLLEWDRWLQTQPIDPLAPTARDTLNFFASFRTGGLLFWTSDQAEAISGKLSIPGCGTRGASRIDVIIRALPTPWDAQCPSGHGLCGRTS